MKFGKLMYKSTAPQSERLKIPVHLLTLMPHVNKHTQMLEFADLTRKKRGIFAPEVFDK
jgi:hypothetical protein